MTPSSGRKANLQPTIANVADSGIDPTDMIRLKLAAVWPVAWRSFGRKLALTRQLHDGSLMMATIHNRKRPYERQNTARADIRA